MKLRFVQMGGVVACQDNGIEGWEYCFGHQDKNNFGSNRYACSLRGRRANWSANRNHITNFQLILRF